MKRTRKMMALLLVIVMALTLAMAPALAAPSQYAVNDNVIDFVSGGGTTPTGPVDPETPTIPASPDPGKQDPTNDTADCRLDLVPIFYFGSNQITTGAQTYYAEVPTDTTTLAPMPYYVQLSDLRGTAGGWGLAAELTQQFSDGTNELTGATIDLKNIETKAADPAVVGTANPDQTLVYSSSGAPVTLATAAAGQGMGVNTVHFGDRATTMDSSVALKIPASTTVYTGTYQATIIWTLTATP